MKILHLDENHPLLISQLADAGFINDEDFTSPKKEVEKILFKYEGIVLRSRFKIDKEFMDAGPNLKFIARLGAGLESIDVGHAEKIGIVLLSAPEGNRNAVGEFTLALLLSLFNKLNKVNSEVRMGEWNREANRGVELDGKTVGLIGYGNMGKAFAEKLIGFSCEVICFDILENVGDRIVTQVSLKEFQQRVDVVSLHTPLTPLTNNMVNAEFIDQFKKSFWLLNTARGQIVVTADLVSALKTGKIKGAGLDVLEYEKSSFESLFLSEEMPKVLSELMKMENVILSPHIAGWTEESKVKLARVIADKIKSRFN